MLQAEILKVEVFFYGALEICDNMREGLDRHLGTRKIMEKLIFFDDETIQGVFNCMKNDTKVTLSVEIQNEIIKLKVSVFILKTPETL